jgi:1-acyl-sn-glycerol-3-phosphate acyltransferase
LLVPNHVSWWDGFLLRELQVTLRPRDALYTVMLEQELSRRPFLRLLGGMGLTPGSPASLRGLLRSLEAARSGTSDVTVLFFPQGRIWPSHRRPLAFQDGIRLVSRALAPVTVLPVGLHLEPGRHAAPTAYLSVGEPQVITRTEADPKILEERVAAELNRIHSLLARWGEDADSHWPDPYGSLREIPEPIEIES